MKIVIKKIVAVPLFLLFLALQTIANAETAEETPFTPVDLDQFIQTERVMDKGKKIIKLGTPIIFEAILKQYPDKRKMSYVYTALEISRFDPIPEVDYRMFVESEDGIIHPVYVENQLVPQIKKQLKQGDVVDFVGYHLYNYSKGPAILVVDFDR